MSRKADCYDNAPMESFFHTLKTELVHHRQYASGGAKRDIFTYIEGFYNRTRRHSAIGYISPIEMELKHQPCPILRGRSLVPRHSDFDGLIWSQSRMGRSCGATRSSMLLATPGWRRIKPFRSRVTTIWWTEGGLTRKVALHVGFGRRAPEHVRVGVDEGQILALLFGEAWSRRAWRLIFDSSVDSSGPPTRRPR